MPDEIKVDAEKFDRILGRMLNTLPVSKLDISERIKEKREAGRKYALELREKNKKYRKAKKPEQ